MLSTDNFWSDFQQSGDVIFTLGHGGKATRLNIGAQSLLRWKGAYWSHVSMCVVPGLFIEAMPTYGVQLVFTEDQSKSPFSPTVTNRYRVARNTSLSPENRIDLILAAIYYFGQPYSRWFVKSKYDTGLEAYCSELIARIYARAHCSIGEKAPDCAWPIDLDLATSSSPWIDVTAAYSSSLLKVGFREIGTKSDFDADMNNAENAKIRNGVLAVAHKIREVEMRHQNAISGIEEATNEATKTHVPLSTKPIAMDALPRLCGLEVGLRKLVRQLQKYVELAGLKEGLLEQYNLTWLEETRQQSDLFQVAKLEALFELTLPYHETFVRSWIEEFKLTHKCVAGLPFEPTASDLLKLRDALALFDNMPQANSVAAEWLEYLDQLQRVCATGKEKLKSEHSLRMLARFSRFEAEIRWIVTTAVPTLISANNVIERYLGPAFLIDCLS